MKNFVLLITVVVSLSAFAQQPFSPGSIVVVRAGSPDSALPASSSPVFLEEFDPNGKHVQTITIPYEGQAKLTLSGRATAEGVLRLSADGKLLTLAGYDLVPGVSSPTITATAAGRSIAMIGHQGQVSIPNILPIDQLYPNNAFRAVVTDNGARYWTAGGTQGVRFFRNGETTSTLISGTATNLRTVDIQYGNLFLSHGSGTVNTRIMQVGENLPDTAGVIASALPGLPTSGVAGCDFVMLDLENGIDGPDVIYLADELGGIRKFSLVDGAWVSNGVLGSAADAFRGLTGIQIPGGGIFYATARGGNGATGGGQLVRFADISGYNQPISGNPEVIAQAAVNTAFRGVALAPMAEKLAVMTYTFNGNGNWSNSENWVNGQVPPEVLPAGHQIVIAPANDGTCIVDIQQKIDKGGIIIVAAGKTLEITGDLQIN
ncbi:MAG TPA: hypothetical protein VK907_13620 [Phnomibacter sp.]|nr:hypothetical protein [Phnomibacter sp.]